MNIQIGDIVKHYRQSRFGIVLDIQQEHRSTHIILVDWFNEEGAGSKPYRYFPYALVKVSECLTH